MSPSHSSLKERQRSMTFVLTSLMLSSMAINGSAAGGGAAQEGLSCQGSLTLPRDLSKKTVDEVWKDNQQNKNGGNSSHERRDKQPTLGEMTLEDLLLKAGVVTETIAGSNHDSPSSGSGAVLGRNITQVGPCVQYHQLPSMPQPQTFMSYPVSDMQAMMSQSSLMGGLSDKQTSGRKRVASGEVVEKTVEKRQKRRIKDRESAARSRTRKQAYTHELEIKVSRLEEETKDSRRQKISIRERTVEMMIEDAVRFTIGYKHSRQETVENVIINKRKTVVSLLVEVEKILPSAPPPDPKRQLPRTSSAPF
ncbi:unnamed protein product [Cochlearia groenlandica]